MQAGDIGRTFSLIAFNGDVKAYKDYSSKRRNTKDIKPAIPSLSWPSGRASVREEFVHNITDAMRGFGDVETRGSGSLSIYINHRMYQYTIIGVCIYKFVQTEKGENSVRLG